MSDQQICPLCGEGHVTGAVQLIESEYKGRVEQLPLHFKVCDVCTSDFAGAEENKLNKRALIAFRKKVDGLLTGDEITALRKTYKLTQLQAAQLFGGGPVAFSKYENDDVAQSESMDTLLRVVRRDSHVFWTLVEEKGMQAEFTSLKVVARASASAEVVELNSRSEKPADCIYNPREFRRFDSSAEVKNV